MSPPSQQDSLIGSTVSQYEVLAKLGGGGMGVVYRARDVKLGRMVALKFLPPQWTHDESAKQRFVREAQAASATNHRNICIIHNIEETRDGRLFIVMAYYEGETLKQKLERGPLPIAEAIEVATEIAEGLAKAHAQLVVHRDVKPGNIIVTEDGVKILDFGLAKFADALQLTAPGSTVGTAAYMSPEQARGEEADARSDVWALGIVLYEMLTGAPPFRGPYPEATFHAIKHEPLPSLRMRRPDVPEALELIVMKALEKDAARRFQSAREPARDLRLLQGRTIPLDLRTEEVPLAARGALQAPREVGRRRSRLWMALAAAVVALGMASGGAYYWWLRPVERIQLAVVPVANHTGVTELDRYRLALTDALIAELSESPNIRVVPYLRLVEVVRPFMTGSNDVSSTQAIQAIASGSGAPFLVVPTLVYRDRDSTWIVEVQIRNAETGTTIGRYETDPVTSSLSQQTAFRLVAAAADGIQVHFRDHGPGRSFKARPPGSRFADPDAARAFEEGINKYDALEYGEALAAFTDSARFDDQHAETHAWRSRVLLILSRKNEAIEAARRAKALAPSEASDAFVRFADGILAEAQGDITAAEKAYRQLAESWPTDPWPRVELADFLKRLQDRNQRAIEAYHDVLKLDASYIRPHVDLCQLYTRIDDQPLAEREAQTALERYRALGSGEGESQALLCLGEAQRREGGAHLADARQNIEGARRLMETLKQPYNLARAVFYQGNVEYSDGRLANAAKYFEEGAQLLNDSGNRTIEGVALMNLAVVNQVLGQPTRASEFYARSRAAFLAIGDERRVAEADFNAAGLEIDYGTDRAAAMRLLANARANLERLGHVNFQIAAMQSEADSYRYDGRITRARTLLRSAFEMAKDKQLSSRMNSIKVALAQVDLDANDYGSAVQSLEPFVDSDAGRRDIDARLALVAGLVRLGDRQAAKKHLDRTLAEIDTQQLAGRLPLARLLAGEIAVEEQRFADARAQFLASITAWGDLRPNAASGRARCGLGLLDGLAGKTDAAMKSLDSGINQGRATGRLALEVECRVKRARVDIAVRAFSEALSVLKEVPEDSQDRSLGPELRGAVEYWRGVARQGLQDVDAASSTERARTVVLRLQDSLPAPFRESFAARPDIQRILQPDNLRTRQ